MHYFRLANRLFHGLAALAVMSGMVLLALSLPEQAGAQEGDGVEESTGSPPGAASLSTPRLDAFPRLEMFLDMRDAEGQFIHGLQPEDIRVLEDGRALPAVQLDELRPGVQVVLALNPGPSLAVRNSHGESRYDLILQTLQAWAMSRRGSTLDDWSLLTNGGTDVAHISRSTDWFSGVMTDTAFLRAAVPSIDTLFRAVAVAADPTPREGMGRAVWFVTPPLEGDLSVAVDNLATQAVLQGIRISVWMVVPTGAPSDQSSEQLATLAQETGGEFFSFTGDEKLPAPEDSVQELRSVYRLSYDSAIDVGGDHQIAVQVQTEAGTLVSPVLDFSLALAPPNPVFVSPALNIKRTLAPESEATGTVRVDGTDEPEILSPERQDLEALIDFPDGRRRPLTRTSLYVDGQLAQTRTTPPFDRFTWDLTPYTVSGSHLLRLEAEDTLGLVGSSMETQIHITVVRPQISPLTAFIRSAPALIGALVVITMAVAFLILVVTGKVQPYSHRASRTGRKFQMESVDTKSDPGPARLPNWVNRLSWPQRRLASKPDAILTPIGDSGSSTVSLPLPVSADELTFGCDPSQATLVLDDPSVAPLHARLVRDPGGVFRIFDEDSVAGVWINYTPVTGNGTILEHGDMVHIGRAGFRFTQRQTKVRKPSVIFLDPETSVPGSKIANSGVESEVLKEMKA